MRIISRKPLVTFWKTHPRAESALRDWWSKTAAASWATFAELKQTFGQSDLVQVASGRPVVVFDIGGNKFRLIAAVHYNSSRVYVLRVLTHDDYDTDRWKRQL